METPTLPEEQQLLAGLREGQAKAFEALMRRYNRMLFRAARGIVRDDAEAQDAVQEAWLRAFLALASFRGEASLGTWLTRIAIHQALRQQRRLGRWVRWNGDTPGEELEMAGAMSGVMPQAAGSAEEEAARGELRRQLEQAIDLLPPLYRCVFILRAVQGLDVNDTALALQVTPETVRTRYLRARAMLRARLLVDPEEEAPHLHDFAGRRCEDIVAAVLGKLRAAGVIRDH